MIIRVSLKEPSSVTNGTEEILLLVTKEILLLAKFKSSYFSRQQVTPFVKMNFRMANSVNQKLHSPERETFLRYNSFKRVMIPKCFF